jgi:type VII secretion integral membrane protein EccD
MTAVSPAAQATDAPRLGKVSLLVGDDTLIDYVLPAGVALIAVIEDLIPRVNAILRKRNAPELDDKLTYRLCRTDATPLDVQRSLDDSGVLDGEVLWLLPADATERYAQTVEEVSTALARSADKQFRRVDATTTRRVAGGLAVGLVAWAELMLGQLWWQRHGWVPAAVSGALTVVLLVAARGLGRARDEHRRATAIMLVWAALIAAGAAAALAVPGPPGGWHLVAAIAVVLAGLSAVAMLTGRYVGVLAASLVIGLCAATVAAVHASGWQVTPAHLAVVFLLVCLLLVTFAPSIGVIAAGVPGPWFPSITNRGIFETPAGGQRNTVSPVARPDTGTVEQITQWARRGTAIVTGLLAGSAVVLVVACRYAVQPQIGGGWRFLVFTLGTCTIFLLRSRSFVDRYQSIILAVSALAGTAMVLGRYASAPVPASVPVTLICVGAALALGIAALLVALVIPKARINAPVNRAVEVSEYVLLILIVPWSIWLLNLLSVVRNAVHGT